MRSTKSGSRMRCVISRSNAWHWRLSATGSRAAPQGQAGTRRERQQAVAAHGVHGRRGRAGDDRGPRPAKRSPRGSGFTGPAIVEFPTTTIVVNPGDVLVVQADGSSLITIAI